MLSAQSPEATMYQSVSYNFFIQFLNSVANGDVLKPTGFKVNLFRYPSDLFYTGSKYKLITCDFSKYVHEFKLNDSRNRFRPSCKTCDGCVKFTIPIVERYEDMVEGLFDAICNIVSSFTIS
ncbi:hypothetical protein GHT06_008816 [Daphnia sinensis]|uniref:Uncharacterized protein n=1 Tax=Daphnia sinensis TaxID=1820382 RepID=A0AAD5LVY8_9CRUS|nr:hypothetical protein GHT06_008816 [Daphnia sinensis]